ncbi:MAG: hypothetical protein ACLPY1_17960 [Terracidiphilus sp.]
MLPRHLGKLIVFGCLSAAAGGFVFAAQKVAQPAEAIAQTAPQFGQDNDITVLTVSRSAAVA